MTNWLIVGRLNTYIIAENFLIVHKILYSYIIVRLSIFAFERIIFFTFFLIYMKGLRLQFCHGCCLRKYSLNVKLTPSIDFLFLLKFDDDERIRTVIRRLGYPRGSLFRSFVMKEGKDICQHEQMSSPLQFLIFLFENTPALSLSFFGFKPKAMRQICSFKRKGDKRLQYGHIRTQAD